MSNKFFNLTRVLELSLRVLIISSAMLTYLNMQRASEFTQRKSRFKSFTMIFPSDGLGFLSMMSLKSYCGDAAFPARQLCSMV
jgi:hypothetical protein